MQQAHWSAAFGDTVTFGGTRQIRRLINYELNGVDDDMADHDSDFYTWGSIGGAAASAVTILATGGVGASLAVASTVGGGYGAYQSYKEGDMVAAITSAAAALPGLGAGARVLGLASRSARASATGATIARSGSWYSTAGKLSDWVGIGAPWFNYTLMSGAAVWKASGTCA